MLGNIGGALAIIGVVVCPITSGDTAFRSARLILAEWTKLNQKKIRNRFVSLITSLPATFMSAVSLTYILMTNEGFGLSSTIAYPVGIAFASILFVIYLIKLNANTTT